MPLTNYAVLQRDANDTAHFTAPDGSTKVLPVGGPHIVDGAENVLVGDIWILAGQSNMEGCGDLIDVETPSPLVHAFEMNEKWDIAEEPLHWPNESSRAVHHILLGRASVPEVIEPRDPKRDKGAGCGLTFAKARLERTGVPVGLVASAHGGTSMQQWDPALRDQGCNSLYGATLERFRAVGGRVAGILWYQGESDTNPADAAAYPDRMKKLIAAFRSDFGQPELPFYLVQLGSFEAGPYPDSVLAWNAIREAQRTLISEIPHTGLVTAIDLALDDCIHIGTDSLKRLGRRLANVADGFPSPTVSGITLEDDRTTIRVKYENVRGVLQSAGHPHGFSVHAENGEQLAAVYKTVLVGDSVILKVQELNFPEGATLYYGYGLRPICNITDSTDAAIPAFGPITLPS